MDIQKEKIVEIFNDEGSKVVQYKQKIKNNTLNEEREIVTEDLNMLMSEVRKQLKEWNNIT